MSATGLVAWLSFGLIAAPTREADGAATVFEGEAVITETNVPDTKIGDPISFTLMVDLGHFETVGRTSVFYPDQPGNGLIVVGDSPAGEPVTPTVGCATIVTGVWNDDATAGDAIGILGTACFDLYSGSVAAAGIQLRDLSRRALESAVFPDPLDIHVFPDEYRVVVGYSFPTALYANITQMPEPEAGAAAATALLALAIVLPARAR